MHKTMIKGSRIKWLVIICIITVILGVLPAIVNTLVERVIKEKLKALPSELTINYSTIHSDILSSSITFTNLQTQLRPYKQLNNHYNLYTSKLDVKGITLLKILLGKPVTVNELRFGKTEIKLNSLLLLKKDSAQTAVFASIPIGLDKISIHKLTMQEISICMESGNKKQLLTRGMLELNELLLDNLKSADAKQFRFATIMCFLNELQYSSPAYGYSIHTGSITINSKAGVLMLDSVRLTNLFPGTNKNTYQVSTLIHKLQLKNWDVHSLLEHKLTADSLLIDESKLYVHETSKRTLAGDTQSLINVIFNSPFAVNIKNIRIQHSLLNYDKVLQAEGNISISNLHNDEHSNAVTGNNFQFSEVHAVYNNITFYTGTPARVIQIKGLLLDSRQALLLANNITVHTVYSKQQLANKLGYQADWIDASVKTISLQSPDINAMLQNRLTGKELVLNDPHVYIYRDRRLPRRKLHQPMPAEILKQIPVDIRIHTVEINNGFINYDEMPDDGFKDGALNIEDMHIAVSPFINHPQSSDPDYTQITTTASLMGSGSISATIEMPLKQNVYHVKGAIQNLDLTTLNSSAENLGKFHIQSGMLNNLFFNFSFTAIKSKGKIVGEYHDLVVQKLNKKREEAVLPSLVLRYIIIPKNKDKSKPLARRVGQINYTRDDTRFISFFLVKSLLTGIRSSFAFGFLLPQ